MNRKMISVIYKFVDLKIQNHVLKKKVRAYLDHSSIDGAPIRKQLREELKKLVE